MTKEELSDLIIRLFESKCKNYTQVTIKVWVDELQTINHNFIPFAVKKAIKSADDFPSVGKLLKIINNVIEEKGNELLNNIIDDKINFETLPDDIKNFWKKYSLKYIREAGNVRQQCHDEFIEVYKKIKTDNLMIADFGQKQIK